MSPSTTKFQIRDAKAEDAQKGILPALAHLTDLGRLTPQKAEQTLRSMLSNPVYKVFVATTSEGDVAGVTTLLIEQKLIHDSGIVGHIEDVAVMPEYEKQGVGSALVKKAVECAFENGCYKVILDCADHNLPFYGNVGFRRVENTMRIDNPAKRD